MNIKLPARAELPPHLSKVSVLRALGLIAFDWGVIAGAIAAALYFPGPLTFVAAQLLVASRQHALFTVMHEGTHYTLCKNHAWNDRISDLLASWPLALSTERYRLRHWIHHRYLNTEKDPDWMRKKEDPAWQLPMPALPFWKNTLVYLVGKGVPEMFFALRAISVRKQDLPLAAPYYLAIAALLTLAGGWKAFALYWLLPYFTVTPLLHRIRNGVEHLALPKTNLLNGTRNVVGSALESFFLGPHQANLHLVHHLYPFVPGNRLTELHSILRGNESYRRHAYENDSYFLPLGHSVYRDMTRQAEEEDSGAKAA